MVRRAAFHLTGPAARAGAAVVGGWFYGATGAIVATELAGAAATAWKEYRDASNEEVAAWGGHTVDDAIKGFL